MDFEMRRWVYPFGSFFPAAATSVGLGTFSNRMRNRHNLVYLGVISCPLLGWLRRLRAELLRNLMISLMISFPHFFRKHT